MKFTIPAGSVASTSNTVFTVGPVVTASPLTVTSRQLAAVWDRPLSEIELRLKRMSNPPSEKEMMKFDRWLREAGLTPAVKARFSTNYGE
jgi:hypothetical protein